MIKIALKGTRRFFGSDIQRVISPAGADEATFVDDVLVVKREEKVIALVPRENVDQVIFEFTTEA